MSVRDQILSTLEEAVPMASQTEAQKGCGPEACEWWRWDLNLDLPGLSLHALFSISLVLLFLLLFLPPLSLPLLCLQNCDSPSDGYHLFCQTLF